MLHQVGAKVKKYVCEIAQNARRAQVCLGAVRVLTCSGAAAL